MTTRTTGLLLIFLVFATLLSAQQAVVKISPEHQPLAEAFNASKDKPRLVTILSPT